MPNHSPSHQPARLRHLRGKRSNKPAGQPQSERGCESRPAVHRLAQPAAADRRSRPSRPPARRSTFTQWVTSPASAASTAVLLNPLEPDAPRSKASRPSPGLAWSCRPTRPWPTDPASRLSRQRAGSTANQHGGLRIQKPTPTCTRVSTHQSIDLLRNRFHFRLPFEFLMLVPVSSSQLVRTVS